MQGHRFSGGDLRHVREEQGGARLPVELRARGAEEPRPRVFFGVLVYSVGLHCTEPFTSLPKVMLHYICG